MLQVSSFKSRSGYGSEKNPIVDKTFVNHFLNGNSQILKMEVPTIYKAYVRAM